MANSPEFRDESMSWIVKSGVTVAKGVALYPATSGPNEVQLAVAASHHIAGVAMHAAAAGEAVTSAFGIVDVLVDDSEAAWSVGDLVKPTASGLWIKTTTAGAEYYGVAMGTTTGGTGESCKAYIFGPVPARIPAS